MAILDILTIPDKLLKEPSNPVEQVDDEVQKLLDNMLETMYDAPGIGLAAPQIGILRRIVTIDIGTREDEDNPESPFVKKPLFMINPEIVWESEEPSFYQEGCLSIPDYYADVERPAEVVVQYIDRDGKKQELKADGLLATCVQHEIDHLDGILFIDYLSKLKRDRVIKKFTKLKKAQAL